MNTNKIQESLIEAIEKIALPHILENYWQNAYRNRQDNCLWNENGIFHDCFKIWGRQTSRNEGEGGIVCLVPNSREFWHLITAIYALKVPEFEGSHRKACFSLHKNLQKFLPCHELSGEFWKNFGPEALNYILEPPDNLFMESPFLCVLLLRYQLMIPGKVSSKSGRWKEMFPVWLDEIWEDTNKRFRELDNFPELEKALITKEEFSKLILGQDERFVQDVCDNSG